MPLNMVTSNKVKNKHANEKDVLIQNLLKMSSKEIEDYVEDNVNSIADIKEYLVTLSKMIIY